MSKQLFFYRFPNICLKINLIKDYINSTIFQQQGPTVSIKFLVDFTPEIKMKGK